MLNEELQTLRGTFPKLEWEREIGRGEHSRVYAVTRDGSPLAAKVGALEALKHEYAMLRRATGKGIVPVHDMIEGSAQKSALLMSRGQGVDFVDGLRKDVDAIPDESLGGLRRNLPIAFGYAQQDEGRSAYRVLNETGLRRLRHCARALAEAVEHLHQAGVLHLDLSRQNVLVDDQEVMVIDFGLAQFRDAATSTSDLCVAAYCAPERSEKPPNEASDWYSVGALLFEALVGQVPFPGEASRAFVEKMTLSPSDPRDLCAGVPDDLAELCLSLLARSPRERGGVQEFRVLAGW